MSDATVNVAEKAIWREMAAHWLERWPTHIKPAATAK
jgi:hypothetical protein